jgi:PilZ domain-containing protein
MVMPAQLNSSFANLGLSPGGTLADGCTERREMPRIELPFPAIVRGVDQTGERFTLETVLDNFSAAGLSLRLMRPVAPGAHLFVVVRFTIAPVPKLAAPGVAARGVVVWAELLPGGAWGVVLKFIRQRFLYADAAP